jgi:hypothetical protein
VGATTVYGEYAKLDANGISDDPNFWCFGVSQGIDGAAASIYTGVRRYSLDQRG